MQPFKGLSNKRVVKDSVHLVLKSFVVPAVPTNTPRLKLIIARSRNVRESSADPGIPNSETGPDINVNPAVTPSEKQDEFLVTNNCRNPKTQVISQPLHL